MLVSRASLAHPRVSGTLVNCLGNNYMRMMRMPSGKKIGDWSETWPWFSGANKRRSPVGYAFLGKCSDLCILFCLNLMGLGRVLLFV